MPTPIDWHHPPPDVQAQIDANPALRTIYEAWQDANRRHQELTAECERLQALITTLEAKTDRVGDRLQSTLEANEMWDGS